MKISDISEDFLHHIWRLQKLDVRNILTTNKEEIVIINIGTHNHDAGPDFFGAKIKIGDTIWAGNVEIHIKSSHWNQHNHQNDEAFNNVILHVVYQHDTEILTKSGVTIPVLELADKIDDKYFDRYFRLKNEASDIPCHQQIKNVKEIVVNSMVDKAAVERIENKTKDIQHLLEYTNGDWEACCYILIGKYFGVRVNKEPFERLTRSLPLKTLLKHKKDKFQIEAMLLGQSGLLPSEHKDHDVQAWIKEYQFLKQKYNLQALDPVSWKFARMRPISFPTIRISQFADLIFKQELIFSKIVYAQTSKALLEIFDVVASDYWDEHYHFYKESESQVKKMGKNTISLLCINVVAPLLFLYGESIGDQSLKDKSIDLLESIDSENNKIIREWKELDVIPDSSFQSQGLIELKHNYCSANRCLHCIIGNSIMQM